MSDLTVTILSIDTTWADPEENLYMLDRSMKKVPADTDVVVLPELFSTGFLSDHPVLSRFAEDETNSPTLSKVTEIAKQYNMAIAGSCLIRDKKGCIRNRAFFIEPSGEAVFYDKHHLFKLSNEASNFVAGIEQIPIVRYRGWNVALAICYDLRFPAWLRNASGRYDVLIIPANWPEKRQYAWRQLLIARAIENVAFVVGANRSGRDDYGQYDDMSFIFDYMGHEISTVKTPGIVTAQLDRDKMRRYRESFPVLNDADKFTFDL